MPHRKHPSINYKSKGKTMNTKTILKTLALAMLMPATLLTTACSSDDDIITPTENTTQKGYALHATINVTRQGDDATRATYDGESKKLSFSAGDKLFVHGLYDEDNLYDFAGVLTWQSGDTFSGTIYLEGPFEGTAEELLSSALGADATLLPAGYGGYGFLSIDNEGTCDASLNLERTKAFALTKATAVEQFSEEFAEEYSNGFVLTPSNAIVSFTISGLEANKEVAVSFKCNHPWGAEYSWSIDDNVTVDATGVATFAVGMAEYENFNNYTLTVDGNAIALPADKEVAAGHIYNISRSVAPAGPTAYTLAESTVGMVVGTDGNAYAVADKDNLPSGVTAAGMVAYKNGSNGLVIALADDGEIIWETAITAAAAHTPTVTGYSWKLPSQDEWKQMFSANGGNESSYNGLNTAIGTAGGTALQGNDGIYWTSTENSYQLSHYIVYLNGGSAMFFEDSDNNRDRVRACLAF